MLLPIEKSLNLGGAMAGNLQAFADRNRKFLRILGPSALGIFPVAVILTGFRGIWNGPILVILVLSCLVIFLTYKFRKAGPIIGVSSIFLFTVLVPLIVGILTELRSRMGGLDWLWDSLAAAPVIGVFRSLGLISEAPQAIGSYLVLFLTIGITVSMATFTLLVICPDKSLTNRTKKSLLGVQVAGPGDEVTWYLVVPGQAERQVSTAELRALAIDGQVASQSVVRDPKNNMVFAISQVPGVFSRRTFTTTILLSFFLGGLGVDRFYLGQTGLGIAKLLTVGGFGVWSLIDFILIVMRKITDVEGKPLA